MIKSNAGYSMQYWSKTAKIITAIVCVAGIGTTSYAQTSASNQGLNGLTAKEARADKIWEMRSGLNVAALQCQFSPFLATVPTYNALLRQHSDEFANTFKTMTNYFIRTQGQKTGQRAFDRYATRANQNWATFDAQYSFCNAAAMVARRALAVPKGQFGEFAEAELGFMRQSLQVDRTLPEVLRPRLEWAVVPTIGECKRNKCKPSTFG